MLENTPVDLCFRNTAREIIPNEWILLLSGLHFIFDFRVFEGRRFEGEPMRSYSCGR